jgi:hypothetical protein
LAVGPRYGKLVPSTLRATQDGLVMLSGSGSILACPDGNKKIDQWTGGLAIYSFHLGF